jgi:AAHS family 4-hydroxybenzoate transporter-like MFS transporter
MYTGAGLGSVIAGVSGPTAIRFMDWEWVFLLGGTLSVLVFVLVLVLLPESVKYLVSNGRDRGRLDTILPRIESSYKPSPDHVFVTSSDSGHQISRNPLRELFRGRRRKVTGIAWAVMLGNQFMVFLLALWMPTLLNQAGVSLSLSLYTLALYNVGGVAGGIGLSVLTDRYGSRRILMFSYPLAGVFVAVFGNVLVSTPLLIAVAILMGGLLIGSSFCLGPYVASLYPTHARSTGIGWALGVGRIGAIISPLAGGLALDQGIPIDSILLLASLPPILCGVLVYCLKGES